MQDVMSNVRKIFEFGSCKVYCLVVTSLLFENTQTLS